MIKRKTKEDHLDHISQRCATMQLKGKIVQMERAVKKPITESRSSIIQINIRLNSVPLILIVQGNVNMVTFVLLLIQIQKYQSNL